MAGDDTTAVEYFKVTEEPLPLNTELHRFGMLTNPFDQVGIGAVERALRRGADHLGTLMDVDLLIAARLGGPITSPLGKYVLEVIFERARAANFSNLPSRLHTVHVFRTRAAADAFLAQYRNGAGAIYTCRVEGQTFDTHMDWINAGFDRGHMEEALSGVQQRATSYWTAETPDPAVYPETLVNGRVVLASGPL